MSPHPAIRVMTLGGTIAMRQGTGDGAVPRLSGRDLIEAVPHLADVAEVTAETVVQVPGAALELGQIIALGERIRAAIDDGVAGAVVTQGTDTLEETAFALDLLYDGDAPVVVTGAMRHTDLAGPDGPANLLAAVVTAADVQARGLGVLVVMNDTVHAAAHAAKRHTANPDAFQSMGCGPLGSVTESRLRLPLRRHRRLPTLRLDSAEPVPDVAVVTASMGDAGALVGSVAKHGYAGCVIEALGGGHLPPSWVEPVAELAAEMPVVLAARVGDGPTLERTYGFAGSESDLIARGARPAGLLDAPKARVALALALAQGPATAPAQFSEIVDAVG